ncbi:MAG: hypothetical protein WCW44_01360 [archaeon]|jgi:hypothetical protein
MIFDFLTEQKGQAALVDSLFFIAIVSTICTGLFYFAINYGLGPEALLNSFYSSDFAMDSLKVITYINVMRDGTPVSLESASTAGPLAEYDYLLALMKEDFAQNNSIGVDTQIAISNTLYSVLRPFDDSIDYIFYISKESNVASSAKYLALIIATHECTANCSGNIAENPGGSSAREVSRVFYSCQPTVNKVLESKIFPNVGKIDSSYGKVNLNDSPYIMGLHTWVSKRIAVLTELSVEGKSDPDLNCSQILTKTPQVG